MKWNVGIAEYWNIGFPTTVQMFQYPNFSIFQFSAPFDNTQGNRHASYFQQPDKLTFGGCVYG
jgi:hypothetical protein